MSVRPSLTFPALIFLNDFDGDFSHYFNAVYEIFRRAFIVNSPTYLGVRVSAQAHPFVDGIHRTFYHITHEGEDENNRTPDIRRMERIRFPDFLINSCPHHEILVWKNQRGRDTRILMFNEAESYLTVLTERQGYNLFWTAYPIDRNHQRRKLINEYRAYTKSASNAAN